jgi:hypothetical protein
MCLKDYDHELISKAFVQIVNFESVATQVTISTTGLQDSIDVLRSTATVLASSNVMDENSFSNPNKVIYSFPLSIKWLINFFAIFKVHGWFGPPIHVCSSSSEFKTLLRR